MKWQLNQILGAYGRVYLVQHNATGKYFAMKTLQKAGIFVDGDHEFQYVLNERNILRDLNSTWIV